MEGADMGRKSDDSWENFIGEMYRRYYDRLMIVACSYTHDRTKAEDLVQEAFLKAILSYRKGGSFLSWACRVIRNSFLDQYRREKRFPEEDIDGIMSDPVRSAHVKEELSDVLYFVLRFAQTNGIDLYSELVRKIGIDAEKYPRRKCSLR